MAANFWESSQKAYMLAYKHNEETWHKKDIEMLGLTAEDCKKIECHYLEQLWEVTLALSMRPRLAATASVYFRKFYIEYCFVDAEPSLVAGTALNLAGKIEECPIRIETLFTSAKFAHSYTTNDIQTCEFFMLDALHCNLIVFHPYRSLYKYAEDAKLDKETVECAVHLANDSYFTDIILRFPPYLISLACLLIATTTKRTNANDFRTWLNKVVVDTDSVRKLGDICGDILNVYTFFGLPNWENSIRSLLPKLPKAPTKPK
jgi:cyclin C